MIKTFNLITTQLYGYIELHLSHTTWIEYFHIYFVHLWRRFMHWSVGIRHHSTKTGRLEDTFMHRGVGTRHHSTKTAKLEDTFMHWSEGIRHHSTKTARPSNTFMHWCVGIRHHSAKTGRLEDAFIYWGVGNPGRSSYWRENCCYLNMIPLSRQQEN